MSSWHALYEAPAVLKAEWGHHRIFAPEAYPAIRAITSVPIILEEAGIVARYVPVCFRKDADRVRLVALMSLRNHALRLPPYSELPYAMQAYPFVVPDDDMIRQRVMWVDKAIADRPTDIGAPVLMDDGKLSKAAFMRAQLALQLATGAYATDALCEDLLSHGVLEPWPLKFDLGEGETVQHDNFLVLAASRLTDPALFALVEKHGAQAGMVLGFQRLSLFRINWLLSNARAQIKAEQNSAASGGGRA